MKRPVSDNLLKDILATDALEATRAATLSEGLKLLRRRHLRRNAIRSGATLCALSLAYLFLRPERMKPAETASPNPGAQHALATMATVQPIAPAPGRPVLEKIGDVELLALFPGRTVVLIGPPGDQQFLLR